MIEKIFSDDEILFLEDKDIFPRKKAVSKKIIGLFADLEAKIALLIKHSEFKFPDGLLKKAGKISHGENYNNQPYIVLDFPRLISKSDIFLFRSVFWWGNYFSISFILSGKYLNQYKESLLTNINLIRNSDVYFSMNEKPWFLEISHNNLVKAVNLNLNDIEHHINTNMNLKLAEIYPINQYDRINDNSLNFFNKILDLLD